MCAFGFDLIELRGSLKLNGSSYVVCRAVAKCKTPFDKIWVWVSTPEVEARIYAAVESAATGVADSTPTRKTAIGRSPFSALVDGYSALNKLENAESVVRFVLEKRPKLISSFFFVGALTKRRRTGIQHAAFVKMYETAMEASERDPTANLMHDSYTASLARAVQRFYLESNDLSGIKQLTDYCQRRNIPMSSPHSDQADRQQNNGKAVTDLKTASERIEQYLSLKPSERTSDHVRELTDIIFAFGQSHTGTAHAADARFALVQRIVKAVTLHPPPDLTPQSQAQIDSQLCWAVSEVGRALSRWDEAYRIGSLSLICRELIEPYPMRMAAAVAWRTSFSILIHINAWNIPPRHCTYSAIADALLRVGSLL